MEQGSEGVDSAPTPIQSDRCKEPGLRILVVDNDYGIRFILSKVLSLAGYKVVSAKDGLEGLETFSKTPFDLVLTDFRMPGMDGWQLGIRIKKLYPDTPIVMITGEVQDDIIGKVERSCVDFVMSKPFNIEDVIRVVENILSSRSHSNVLSSECRQYL
ncbi:MAG: response regulator [Deltaproteobacteria bacterium]|nr:response regulator [Deltaproteobacteria bacterium]